MTILKEDKKKELSNAIDKDFIPIELNVIDEINRLNDEFPKEKKKKE